MRNLLIALALIIPSTAFADPCTDLPPWKRPAECNPQAVDKPADNSIDCEQFKHISPMRRPVECGGKATEAPKVDCADFEKLPPWKRPDECREETNNEQ